MKIEEDVGDGGYDDGVLWRENIKVVGKEKKWVIGGTWLGRFGFIFYFFFSFGLKK